MRSKYPQLFKDRAARMVLDRLSALPVAASGRLSVICLGWILVARAEATASTLLAVAIAEHWSPSLVAVSAVAAW